MSSWLGTLATIMAGFVVWRLQLIGKRRTEIAEEALLTFARAADALRAVRSPVFFPAEEIAVRRELGVPAGERLHGRALAVLQWRLDKHAEKFVNVRKVQLLCRYHFGQELHDAFETLLKARDRVSQNAYMLQHTELGIGAAPESRKLREEWESRVWPEAQADEIGHALDDAQLRLETLLAPHLRADAMLFPIAASWNAVRLSWLPERWRRRRGG